MALSAQAGAALWWLWCRIRFRSRWVLPFRFCVRRLGGKSTLQSAQKLHGAVEQTQIFYDEGERAELRSVGREFPGQTQTFAPRRWSHKSGNPTGSNALDDLPEDSLRASASSGGASATTTRLPSLCSEVKLPDARVADRTHALGHWSQRGAQDCAWLRILPHWPL